MFRLIVFLSLLVVSMTYEIRPMAKDGLSASFLKIGDAFYYIETKLEKNWFDAYETCRLIGAELITIDTIEEWRLVNKFLKDMNIDGEPYWTSGTDLAHQGNHVWFSNGLSITLGEIWYPGEPNNDNSVEHCDEMSFTFDGFHPTGLNDKDCYINRRYICEARQPISL